MTTEREKIQITKLSDQGKSSDLEATTSADRLGMIYQLVIDAWAFKGVSLAQSRLSRHVRPRFPTSALNSRLSVLLLWQHTESLEPPAILIFGYNVRLRMQTGFSGH